ncbi:hypothetical protein GCM10027174_45720 [Salinifilum aidingensis]
MASEISDDICNGQWFRFAAPMSYGSVRNAAIFLAVPEANVSKVRLLLHGSVVHMSDQGVVAHASVDELSQQASEQFADGFLSPVHPDCWASPINNFIDLMALGSCSDFELHGKHEMYADSICAASLGEMIPLMERRLRLPYTAEWLGGYAQAKAVTSVHGRTLVFATPLYAERIAPPS